MNLLLFLTDVKMAIWSSTEISLTLARN